MGIPLFNRYLCENHPHIFTRAKEQVPQRSGRCGSVKSKLNEANPNKFEVGMFYLDLNALIHTANMNVDGDSIQERIAELARALDRLVNLIRPRSLLYLAIDGVAPKAKVELQRARRYRVSAEAQAQHSRSGLTEFYKTNPPFDTCAISPGTEFMVQLSQGIQSHFEKCIAEDTTGYWSKIKVILSDAQVPGEGELKILHHLHSQIPEVAELPFSHVIYSRDSDLIPLSLTTALPNIYILREDLSGLRNKNLNGSNKLPNNIPYQLININLLRSSLITLHHHYPPTKSKAGNLEQTNRTIRDWCLLLQLLGNDYLPALVEWGDWSYLMRCYQNYIQQIKSSIPSDLTKNKNINLWLDDGSINWSGLANILQQLQRQKKSSQSLSTQLGEMVLSDADLAKKYQIGLAWVSQSIHSFQPITWIWSYPSLKASPKLNQLIRTFKCTTPKALQDDDTLSSPSSPPTPIYQLAHLLPPTSYHLLPESLAQCLIQQPECLSDKPTYDKIWEHCYKRFTEREKLRDTIRCNPIVIQ